MAFKDIIGKLRGWIDDEEDVEVSEKRRAPSRWEEFLVTVARGIEEVMQAEMFTPPGEPTYIPPEYIVFLSKEDDADWQGEKRRGFERGLHTVIAERARELVGSGRLQTQTIALELRVDPNLEKGKFRVQPVWDSTPEMTQVKPRTPPKPAPAPAPPSPTIPKTDRLDEGATVVKPRGQTAGLIDDEATVVRPRAALFSITVLYAGQHQSSTPCYKPKVGIGRGSQEDVRLTGDMEISRSHLELERADDGRFYITCLGRNPVIIGGKEVQTDKRAEVTPGEPIYLCSFTLQIDLPATQPLKV